MHVDFEREREWWDAKAAGEEQDLQDETINRALRWREIERHLEGVSTILSVGGGTGAFSIPLARRGFRVTHLDLSPAMLAIARQKAEGVRTIEFVRGNAVDLSRFPDRAFDLVLNMDGAISFCGDQAERALLESCRVTGRVLIVSVSHRAMMATVWATESLAATGRLLPAVYAIFERGEWHQDAFPENVALSVGCTQDYMGALRAFLPEELRQILEGAGMRVLRCGGLGSLSGLCGPQSVGQLLQDSRVLEGFLDLCERFDRDILPHGPGTRQRAGLIAVAERVE
jgi:ubiquinone/menaquinone biosynthesis C-methylase UbiE